MKALPPTVSAVLCLFVASAGTGRVRLLPYGLASAQEVSFDHHILSHHGQDPTKLGQLKTVETEALKLLGDLLTKPRQTKEDGATLLDRTAVFRGSNLGGGNSHSCKNLPALVADGGFRHGRHLAFDPKNPPPLSNLYVSLLQRLGLEVDRFGSSTGTLIGLEPVG
jgi:hypothetical protein